MTSKIQLVLALVLGGTWFVHPATAQPAEVAGKDEFHWGDIVAGFQIGAALDESNGIIHCRIRNAATNEVDYPSFDFGYFEFIHLEISDSTNWTRIGVTLFPRSGGYSSAVPYLTQKIGPGQIILGDMTRYRPYPILTGEEYLSGAHGDTNEAVLTERLNKRLAARQNLLWTLCRDDTFALDLDKAAWPTNDFTQPSLNVRVSQEFRTKHGEHLLTLYAPEFTVKSSLVQTWKNEENKLFGR